MSKPTIPLTPGKYYHIFNRGINSCPIFHDDYDHERFLYLYEKYVGQVVDTLAWVLMRTHFHLLIRVKENMVYRYSMDEIRKMEAAQRNSNAGRFDSPASQGRDATRLPGADGVDFPRPEDKLAFAKWETVNVGNARSEDFGTSAGRNGGKAFSERPRECRKPNKTPNPSAHLGHLFNAYARFFNLKYRRHGSLFEHQFKRKPIKDEWYLRNVIVYIHKNPEHHGYYSDFRHYPWSSYHSCLKGDDLFFGKEAATEWFGNLNNYKMAHGKNVELEDMEA